MKMKFSATLFGLLLCGFADARAQLSLNVVGYYNLPVYAGDNFIANQLDTTNNTINSLLNSSSVPNGSTFTKWDPAGKHFLPVSTYDATESIWTINYSLNLTEGGLFHSSSRFTNTFVGEVNQTYYDVDTSTFKYANYPSYADGMYLISCPVPKGQATFQNVVGRAPHDGEWVEILDPATQSHTVTTFDSSLGTWDHGDPALGVGESALFDLGPVPVPEPSTIALASLGAGGWLMRRRRRGLSCTSQLPRLTLLSSRNALK
jgi:hypothetical protein